MDGSRPPRRRSSLRFLPRCPAWLAALLVPALLLGAANEAAAGGKRSGKEDAERAAVASRTREAALAFLDGRLKLEASTPAKALEDFARAVELEPADAFLRLEYARVAVRASAGERGLGDRQRLVDLTLEQLRAARKLAGNDFQVLKETGLLYLDLARERAEVVPAAREALEAARAARASDAEVLGSLGQIYRASGELEPAAEAFRGALRYAPAAPWARTLLARTLADLAQTRARERNFEAQEALLEEALAAEPTNVEVRSNLAELVSRRGDHAAAVQLLSEAARESLRPEQRQRLIWELYLNRQVDEAFRLAQELEAETPGSYLNLVVLLKAARGAPDEAAADLAKVLAKEPSAAAVPPSVVRALLGSGFDLAAAQFIDALFVRVGQSLPAESDAALRVERAELALARQQWVGAQAVLTPLAERDGAGATGEGWKLLLAEALLGQGRGEDALAWLPASLPEAAEERSRRAPLLAKRAEVLWRLDRAAEANALLQDLAASQEPGLVLQAARVYQRLERFADAVPVLERLLRLDPRSIEGAYFLGVALERTAQGERSIATFRGLVRDQPDFAPALNYLGYLWAERGENLEEALALVERAVALDPSNGAYIDSLGWANYRLGRFPEARKHLEQAVALLPDDATVLEHLGDVYAALGERALAEQTYRRALDLKAGNADEVRRKLAQLDRPQPPG
jgi:tetratricopeptide (TPR) repeat protein